MRYIDKYQWHAESHAINVRFLRDCYAADIAHPIPSPEDAKRSYDDFKKADYRDGAKGWKSLLLREQTAAGAPRCCYCMRRLNESAGWINYEHVIPRTLKSQSGEAQYQYYSQHAPALRDFVLLADEFCRMPLSTLDELEQRDKMPHTTALANLLAACNGVRERKLSRGCCCNGARGDHQLLPIMLMPGAESMIKYDANGLVILLHPVDDTWRTTLQELNSDTLMEIRSVWFHLSRVRRDLTNAVNMPLLERIEWFKAAYATDNFATLPPAVKKFVSIVFAEVGNDKKDDDDNDNKKDKDEYWRLLMAYDWFYDYPGYACQREVE